MKTKLSITKGLLFVSILLLAGCGSTQPKEEEKPVNITILLDLSSRVGVDEQKDRDVAIIKYVTDKFISHATAGGKLLKNKDHLKVMFYPTPQIGEVNVLSKNLDVNLAKLQPADKKKKLMGMDTTFMEAINKIYNKTIEDHKWVGCDIWGFFSEKRVDNFCMTDSSRNILIVLTDGYIDDVKNRNQQGSYYTYINQTSLRDPNSELLVKRDGLDNLEVLMLEIRPYSPQEIEPIKVKIENWLLGMGVKTGNYQVVESDLPNNVEEVVDHFLGF